MDCKARTPIKWHTPFACSSEMTASDYTTDQRLQPGILRTETKRYRMVYDGQAGTKTYWVDLTPTISVGGSSLLFCFNCLLFEVWASSIVRHLQYCAIVQVHQLSIFLYETLEPQSMIHFLKNYSPCQLTPQVRQPHYDKANSESTQSTLINGYSDPLQMEDVQFTKVLDLEGLPEYNMIIVWRLTKQGTMVVVKADLLKNSCIFTFKNSDRIKYAAQFINKVTSIIRYGNMRIHQRRRTFQMVISHFANQGTNRMSKSQLRPIAMDDIKELRKYMEFNVYHILYLAGQIEDTTFQVIKQLNVKLRPFNIGALSKIDHLIQTLKTSSQTGETFNRKVIEEFRTFDALPKTVEVSGRAKTQAEQSSGLTKSPQNKPDSISKPRQLNPALAPYQLLLKQVAYPTVSNQLPGVYTGIRLSKDLDNCWEVFLETSKTRISKKKASFTFSRERVVSTEQYIHKLLIRKECLGISAVQKAQQQRRILAHMKQYSSVAIAKFYYLQNQPPEYRDSIIMDLYSESSLDVYLRQNAKVISQRSKLLIMPMIVQGTRFLRDVGIVHMDMKIQNVLLGRGMIPRLTDFGQSRIIGDRTHIKSGFTIPYTAPELFQMQEQPIDNTIDTFSIGVMLDLLLKRSYLFPYKKNENKRLEDSLRHNTYPNLIKFTPERYLDMFPPKVAQLLWTLVLLCLHPTPGQRPNQDIICIALKVAQKVTDDIYT